MKNEWIKVKDRLPEENGQYLANVLTAGLDSEGDVIKIESIEILSFCDREWGKWEDKVFAPLDNGERVLHWMELPDFPEDWA